MRNIGIYIGVAICTVYKVVKPVLNTLLYSSFGGVSQCKHTPSCSVYAEKAIREHGLRKGIILAIVRLSRCR